MGNAFLSKKRKLESLKKLRYKNLNREYMIECPSCNTSFSKEELKNNNNVCEECDYYFSLNAYERIESIVDKDTFEELNGGIKTTNPLDFPSYEIKLNIVKEKTGLEDAIVTGVGLINGIKAAIGVLDSRFLMGSMGTVVGEKIVLLTEHAMNNNLPLIIFSASGGARMQEGLFSLMQMAKTSGAIQMFKDNGGLFISCLTNPTTGGVSASYASLGDIIVAEPGALICFAGPRVIEQTIGQTLPEGFQRAEFLLKNGMLDRVVKRKHMKEFLYRVLRLHNYR